MDCYIALLHRPKRGSSWGVTFPDVPGCASAGDSFEEALANARDALSGHLALLEADGDPIPAPRRYEEIMDDPNVAEEVHEAVVSMIYPRRTATPRVRINISVDPELLRAVDEAAETVGRTRSGYIEEMLRERLKGAG